MTKFIGEDDLQAFDVWIKEIQGIDPAMLEPDELADWRSIHADVMAKSAATPKVGLMKLRARPGENLYAVAIREGSDLWLTLWVRRSSKGAARRRPRPVALLRSGETFLRAELFLKAAKNRWIACAQTAKGHIHQNVVFVNCGSL
jgi:hypothetical protein